MITTIIITVLFVALAVQPGCGCKMLAVGLFTFDCMVLGGEATTAIVVVAAICFITQVLAIFA
jgi:hypothetical protein